MLDHPRQPLVPARFVLVGFQLAREGFELFPLGLGIANMSRHSSPMYRLHVDEVGTDDLGHLEADEDRYLSLTGIAMEIDKARDDLESSW